jgi:adenosylhomocysteine nucleosidase
MIESDPGLVRIAGKDDDHAFPNPTDATGLMIGTMASGDKYVKNSETLRWLQQKFLALATEMEGAAAGYTFGRSDVPFVVIRGISDVARETAHTDFKDNFHKFCQNSYQILEEFVPLYKAL